MRLEGIVLEVDLPRREQITYLGKERFACWTKDTGKLYRFIFK